MKTKIKIDAQRLRNLTTGRLHTKMEDIYADLEMFTDTTGIMTHMLPNIMKAVKPYLINNLCDASFGRFLDGNYDPSHTGTVEIEPLDDDQKSKFWKAYSEMDSPLTMLGSTNKISSETVKPTTPPSPKKCQAQMISPVIRKICDKLEKLDFQIMSNGDIELQFLVSNVFIVSNNEDYLDLYIDGVKYTAYNLESGKLLHDTYIQTKKLKKLGIEECENKRKRRILELGINNILQA